jgi:hypothetical protein
VNALAKCNGRVPLKDDDGQMLRDTDGQVQTRPCERPAIAGGKVCPAHGGKAPRVKAKAAVIAEVMRWGLGDTKVDPGETLLRLVSQSAARAERYAAELEQFVEQHGGDLAAALVGDTLVLDKDGGTVKVGEYVRGLAQLEAAERDRCANMATKAIAAGLAERQVRLAERQAEVLAELIEAALAGAGVTGAAITAGRRAAAQKLRLIQGAS